jgi:hypothetical protein
MPGGFGFLVGVIWNRLSGIWILSLLDKLVNKKKGLGQNNQCAKADGGF